MTVFSLTYWYDHDNGVERFCGVYGSQGEAEKVAFEEFGVDRATWVGNGDCLRARGVRTECCIQSWSISE